MGARQVFAEIKPVTTPMQVAGFADPGWPLEIGASAGVEARKE